MTDFLVTKINKGDIIFGFNIRRSIQTWGPYPWTKDSKSWRIKEWYIQLNLFVVELDWMHQKFID